MGAQVLREVSRQTNEVAGDGTTTATVLADSLVQKGLAALKAGANAVDLVHGLEQAVLATIDNLKRSARPVQGNDSIRAVASIAANNDPALGAMVAEAFERAGPQGIVDVQFGISVETVLEVIEGMGFDRGYLSHHMVTDVEKMQVVLDNPLILMTDNKIQKPDDLATVYGLAAKAGRPLLIIAEEVAPSCIIDLLQAARTRQGGDRGDPSAGIRPLAEVDARGHRHRHGRAGDRPRHGWQRLQLPAGRSRRRPADPHFRPTAP